MEKEEYFRLRDDADLKLQALMGQMNALKLSMRGKKEPSISDPLYDTLCDLSFDVRLTREALADSCEVQKHKLLRYATEQGYENRLQ